MPKIRFDEAAVLALIQDDAGGPAAAWLSGEGALSELDEEQALAAVEAARRLGRGERLAQAKAQAPSKAVRKAAGAALQRFRSAGGKVAVVPKAKAWSLGRDEYKVPPPIAIVGLPNMEGYFPFVFVAHDDNGAVAFAGTAGAGQGFTDADHAHCGRSQARKIVADARKEHRMFEVPPHVALHFLERAFREGGQSPKGWAHLTELLDPGMRNTARLLDPMAKQAQELDPQALLHVEPLLDESRGVYFGITEDVSEAAVQELFAIMGSPIEVSEDERNARVAEAIGKAADAAVAGAPRRTWALSMDLVAWLADFGGGAAFAASARHTALALASDLPGSEIPFVRAWTERQLAFATQMVMNQGGSIGERLAKLKEEMGLEEDGPAAD